MLRESFLTKKEHMELGGEKEEKSKDMMQTLGFDESQSPLRSRAINNRSKGYYLDLNKQSANLNSLNIKVKAGGKHLNEENKHESPLKTDK